MTWPFENDTSNIVKKLAKQSLVSEKRRNLMVVISVALAAFLICFAAVISVSIAQIQRNQVADTYEAVFTGIDASGVAALKDLPEFARVGEYYLLGEEHSRQGYNISYVYRDSGNLHVAMNSNYFAFHSKSVDFVTIFGIAALVLMGAYVVIQSIFRISINDKIQSYGQLRTIGATAKQLRSVVKKESRQLCGIGILLGVLLGISGGLLLFPKGFHGAYYGMAALLTAVVCWFMVSISVRRPVKIAAGISPLQATRFSAGQKKVHGRRKHRNLSPLSMGFANFQRDRKKSVSIAASLSLGGILLLVVSSMILTRSPEKTARLFFPDGDYKIYLSSKQPGEEIMAAGNPLNENLRQELLSVDGVRSVLVTRRSLHAQFGTSVNTEAGMCDMLTDENRLEMEAALVSGVMPENSRSVLLGTNYQKALEDIGVGASMELSLGQETVTVTVSGLFDVAKTTNGHGALAMDSAALFAPEGLFLDLHPEIESFDYSWSIVSDPEESESVESGLKEIVSGHDNLGLDTMAAHIEYEKMQSSIIFGSMQAVSWLIFLFGVVNLINTTLSNQMSRKRENSILRFIGLTEKQLCRMNVIEGICYAFFAALTILIVGVPVSMVICMEVSKKSFVGKVVPYQFPVLEMGLFLLVLFGLEVILSVWMVRRQKKQSLVEQMRALE